MDRDEESRASRERTLTCDLLLELARKLDDPGAVVARRVAGEGDAAPTILDRVVRWHLAAPADKDGPSMLYRAGEQYLARAGKVRSEALGFLPRYVDDLHAREALRSAGFVLVDEFHGALRDGDLVEHARSIVPAGFSAAVDLNMASRLYGAACALMARLSSQEAPGCVAEEILAVRLVGLAELQLEVLGLQAEDREHAERALHGIFELSQDDDVMMMFEMIEPADAAVAGGSTLYEELGVADQRIEAWFEPFGWTIPTGHLDDTPPDPGNPDNAPHGPSVN